MRRRCALVYPFDVFLGVQPSFPLPPGLMGGLVVFVVGRFLDWWLVCVKRHHDPWGRRIVDATDEGSAARTFDEGLAGGDHLGDIIDTGEEGMIFMDIGPDEDEWDNYAKPKFYTG